MRFLIDNALSPIVADRLKQAGYDAVHVRDYGMQTAPDDQILDRARREARILVSADTDFGFLLAQGRFTRPSVIIFRRGMSSSPQAQAAVLLEILPSIHQDLERGCVVVIETERLRIRNLPIQ